LGFCGIQWHQLDHTQTICTSLQIDNHTNTSSLNFYRQDALPDAQPAKIIRNRTSGQRMVWSFCPRVKLNTVLLHLWFSSYYIFTLLHTHIRLTALFSGTIRVSQYQKGKTNLDFTEARDSEWQWHQLGQQSRI